MGSLCELGHCECQAAQVLAQLTVSEVLTKESRDAGSAPFVEFQAMIRDAMSSGSFGMISRWN